MIRTPFVESWSFGPLLGAFEQRDEHTAVVPVTLPHDAIRDLPRSPASPQGVNAGYHPGGVFEYTKRFDVPDEWRSKTVTIEFEGVYRDAVVRINGDLAGRESSGYRAFAVRADGWLRFGAENRITVEARSHKDSRWYTGAGIYRPVHLIVADPVHLALDGVRVRTVDADAETATLELAAVVENDTRHTRTVRVAWSVLDDSGRSVVEADAPVTVLPGAAATARVRVLVDRPRRWSIDEPTLYDLRTTIAAEDDLGMLDDSDLTRFGIRTLALDPRRGLRINGETVKLRGACVHHDNGPLGAVTLAAAEDRRIRLLKEAGFTAVRSAHNPAGRALLDACDRHGMVVMDELTDVWTRPKTAFDNSLRFPDEWADEAAALVAKDVNHPSVVMYSIGNEILELATPHGATWSRRIAERIRELDPTRFVTNGINGIIANLDRMAEARAEAASVDPNTMMADLGEQMAALNSSPLVSASIEESAAVLDVVGFNYGDSRYPLDAENHPHRVIVGSETFPARIGTLWPLVLSSPHVIGDFTWAGWDYLGEAGIGRVDYTDADGYVPTGTAGPFPYLTAESGDLDITGHRRTVSYYREIVFGQRTDPFIAVHRPQHHGRPTAVTPWSWDDTVASWTWDASPGAPVSVDVYADADEVELVLDGRTLGVAPVGAASGADRPLGVGLPFVAAFEIEYRPGELVAVARRAGEEVGRTALRTATGPLTLDVRADRDTLPAGTEEAAFLTLSLRDAAGTVPCDADRLVTVVVEGAAVLAGIATGRARTEEGFAGPAVTTYDGRALAVIRPSGTGTATVTVTAEGLTPVTLSLEVG